MFSAIWETDVLYGVESLKLKVSRTNMIVPYDLIQKENEMSENPHESMVEMKS